jgi:indolepyruvate ferredoxin oxidoreductase
VHQAEQALAGGGVSLPLTRAVAHSLLKLMSYKDEYEVARLYTDGRFQQRLAEQFEGTPLLRFHMAPPLLARPKNGQPPRKIEMGPWLLGAMRWLARGKALRGTPLDPFGRTEERRMERALIPRFEARVDELLAGLVTEKQALAAQVAAVPLAMRGFGHVKLANVALAQAREAELLHRWDPARYPRPAHAPQAGQLRGIAVVSAR